MVQNALRHLRLAPCIAKECTRLGQMRFLAEKEMKSPFRMMPQSNVRPLGFKY